MSMSRFGQHCAKAKQHRAFTITGSLKWSCIADQSSGRLTKNGFYRIYIIWNTKRGYVERKYGINHNRNI